VKSGWLRKQGGIVKSWQRRYCVMKGDYIYYYTSDEDCSCGKPPLGSIFLPGNHVIEIPFNPADVEKFQFEIQTGLFLQLHYYLLNIFSCYSHTFLHSLWSCRTINFLKCVNACN